MDGPGSGGVFLLGRHDHVNEGMTMIVKTNQSGPNEWSAWLPDHSAKASGETRPDAVRNLKDSVSRRALAEEQELEAARRRFEFWRIRRDALMEERA